MKKKITKLEPENVELEMNTVWIFSQRGDNIDLNSNNDTAVS